MNVVEAGLAEMVEQAKAVVAQMGDEGRSVPEWADTQVKLAEAVLDAHRRGENYRYALDALILHGEKHKAEQDAFFAQ